MRTRIYITLHMNINVCIRLWVSRWQNHEISFSDLYVDAARWLWPSRPFRQAGKRDSMELKRSILLSFTFQRSIDRDVTCGWISRWPFLIIENISLIIFEFCLLKVLWDLIIFVREIYVFCCCCWDVCLWICLLIYYVIYSHIVDQNISSCIFRYVFLDQNEFLSNISIPEDR